MTYILDKINYRKKTLTLATILIQSVMAYAQDSIQICETPALASDSIIQVNETVKKPGFFSRALDGFTNFFMGCDTNYVTPQKYQFTVQGELSYWHDFYHMQSLETGNNMVIESDPSLVAGGYVYYSIFGYGVSWNLNDINNPNGAKNGTSRRQSLSIHTAKIFAEIYSFNSGKGAKITHVTDYDLTNKPNKFLGLDSRCNGFQAFYIFNNKHFSWPAAYGENAVQRKSCGTFNLGFAYNHQSVSFDKNELPDHLKDIDPTMMFNEVDYKDYSLSIGYAYNCVLGKNTLFAFNIQPALGYRRSEITEADDDHSLLENMSTDVNIRSSIIWNNSKYFTGLILDLHTYSYRQKTFGLTNTYGTLKFVCGFNFLKKRHGL